MRVARYLGANGSLGMTFTSLDGGGLPENICVPHARGDEPSKLASLESKKGNAAILCPKASVEEYGAGHL